MKKVGQKKKSEIVRLFVKDGFSIAEVALLTGKTIIEVVAVIKQYEQSQKLGGKSHD